MIDKERLEELIEQGATIWGVYDYTYSYDKPNKKVEHINLDMFYHYYKDIEEFIMYQGDYCDLFETKEEAEWHREFGRIERTERLELPTWEEFEEKKFVWFFDSYHKSCCLHYLNCNNKIFINNGSEVIEIGDFTKENYTIACRKAKELFLGEKK